jgi:hypothetical protein
MKRFVLLLALVACQSTAKDDELVGAKAQVQRFFDALGKSDCATIGSLLPAANDCDKFLHEWRDDLKIQLVDMPDVQRDGRDKRAIIVTTTVMRRGEQKTMLVRVTHEKGVWQLVL